MITHGGHKKVNGIGRLAGHILLLIYHNLNCFAVPPGQRRSQEENSPCRAPEDPA